MGMMITMASPTRKKVLVLKRLLKILKHLKVTTVETRRQSSPLKRWRRRLLCPSKPLLQEVKRPPPRQPSKRRKKKRKRKKKKIKRRRRRMKPPPPETRMTRMKMTATTRLEEELVLPRMAWTACAPRPSSWRSLHHSWHSWFECDNNNQQQQKQQTLWLVTLKKS